ncbi:Vacuolar sorting protein SNF7, putative [Perkinsus marinus ATCC 50983]|uniref:Vacuolar sorting protein SNF7, putative n=1 Tax=Perkinsus marinus (strain ATCC 50983 / TXsc) TaxID=423536 RepID=C5KKF3_PERM5|nr:Vacuolar sorting protein SNF7, putative [Perkinsus marinus ATCC 50983]EER15065.1 Vacuolar sorting protein SNF7, putative [Perkinsus marinus ATCC 50983]|eukprot:XP_002783269.1 Vacuolar sorting protein SNF7, putative [Perkinsus marinus ATCC 50983]
MASVGKASVFCDTVGTTSGMLRGVKVGSPTVAGPVDKAHLVHRIALGRIDTMEESLTAAWSKADSRAREHLRAGRKPLALQALKERSLLQGRLDELGKYRLQLQSTSGFTATAEIQSIVVEALSASTMMAKEQKVDLEHVDKLAEDMQEVREDIEVSSGLWTVSMRDSLQLVSDAIAAMSLNGGAAVEQDPDLQAELDKLMDEQQDIDVIAVKEQVGCSSTVCPDRRRWRGAGENYLVRRFES